MRHAYPVARIRAAEKATMQRVGDEALMQRAAAGLAAHCTRLLGSVYGRRVVVVAGAGNNGGDALFAGAALARRGAAVVAVLTDPARAHTGGLTALWAAGGRAKTTGRGLPDVRRAELVLDAVVGIGGSGALRRPAATLFAAVAPTATVVAVDLPSGLDADTGAVGEPVADGLPAAVRADVTVTFGALKPGLLVGAGAEYSGDVRLVDIGLGAALSGAEPVIEQSVRVLEAADVAALLPVPTGTDDKYTRGVVGVSAGSAQYSGAAVLCTGAALHGGAGMVRYAGAAGEAIRARWPEAIVHDRLADAGRVQAWAVGPGLGTDENARQALSWVLEQDVPVLVDADGITLLAAVLSEDTGVLARRSHATVITPHDREFERIAGSVGPDRLAAARRAARELGVTVLLKGEATIVATPDGGATVNRTGTPWLGTAGSGDVLSGLIGSLLAGGLDPGDAAAVGAFLHGLAGQRAAAGGPPTSADVLAALRPAIGQVVTGR